MYFLQETPVTDPISFLQYGILGLVLLALVGGYLWTKPAVEAIQKVSEDRRQQVEQWEAELLPLLRDIKAATQSAANTSGLSTGELRRLADLLQYQNQTLERLAQALERRTRGTDKT